MILLETSTLPKPGQRCSPSLFLSLLHAHLVQVNILASLCQSVQSFSIVLVSVDKALSHLQTRHHSLLTRQKRGSHPRSRPRPSQLPALQNSMLAQPPQGAESPKGRPSVRCAEGSSPGSSWSSHHQLPAKGDTKPCMRWEWVIHRLCAVVVAGPLDQFAPDRGALQNLDGERMNLCQI